MSARQPSRAAEMKALAVIGAQRLQQIHGRFARNGLGDRPHVRPSERPRAVDEADSV
jgi:hypothetical protein